MGIIIVIKLFLAHILTDFIFQPNSWIENKKKFRFHFWFHSFLAGFFTYILLAEWTCFGVPIFIFITHAIIDAVKVKLIDNKMVERQRFLFFVDQLFHIIVIILAWLFLVNGWNSIFPFIEKVLTDKKALSLIVAFIFVTIPAGIIIGQITEPFRNKIDNSDGLEKAGIYIGVTERILILIFVLMGQYAAIGLLIAGKSILRVAKEGDVEGRKKTEYILIGTLISFTIAIIVGLLVKVII